MRLERVHPPAGPAAARQCHELYLAGHPADDPGVPAMSLRAFTGWLAHGWSENHPQAWLARDSAGRACGWYSLGLPERENTRLAEVSLLTGPAWRRRGIGTGLIRHAAAQAAGRGRTHLAVEARLGSATEAFCRALGASPGLVEVVRVLWLDGIPAGRLARLRGRAQAAAAGFSLLEWAGPAPECYLGQVASLAQAISDAPHDSGRQEQRWDKARVRESEARVQAQGLRYYTVAARHDATGVLAGMTQLGVDPATPECGYQEGTMVARPHRGHRLGLLVKVAMLQLLAGREPQLRQIVTGNAGTNTHMAAINDVLGFQLLDRRMSWELPGADLLRLPAVSH